MRFSVAVRLFLNFYNQQYFFQIGHFEIFVSFMDPITRCVVICYLGMCGMCHAVVPHSPFSTNMNYTCTRATLTSSGSIRDISISDFQGQHCQLFRKCFYLLFSMSSRHVLLDNSGDFGLDYPRRCIDMSAGHTKIRKKLLNGHP